MKKKEVRCYGLMLSTAEVFMNIYQNKMPEFLKGEIFVGVYQDPAGQYQMFIFEDEIKRKHFYKKMKDNGFKTCELVPEPVYVEQKYYDEYLERKGDSK